LAAVVVILLCVATGSLSSVLGQSLPPPSPPKALSQYGVARVYASTAFNGRATITITSREAAPFYVVRLTLFLANPAASQIILNSINIDATGAIQISGTTGSFQAVIVAAGLTYGDIVQSIPNYLSFLIVKDPLGDDAIVANGGSGGGIVIGIGVTAGAFANGATITAIATIVAPTDTVVSLSFS